MNAIAALIFFADAAAAPLAPQVPRLAGAAEVVRPVALPEPPPFGRLGAAIAVRKRPLEKPVMPIS